jgi:hypothetical protein
MRLGGQLSLSPAGGALVGRALGEGVVPPLPAVNRCKSPELCSSGAAPVNDHERTRRHMLAVVISMGGSHGVSINGEDAALAGPAPQG